jgi:hypothetical protein
MRFPLIFVPFIPLAIGVIVLDKITGGLISGSAQKDHDEAVRKQFHWTEGGK